LIDFRRGGAGGDIQGKQGVDSVRAQESVPPVGFERLIVLARGFAPPAVPEKLRLIGFRSMLGVAVVVLLVEVVVVVLVETTKVIGIVAV